MIALSITFAAVAGLAANYNTRRCDQYLCRAYALVILLSAIALHGGVFWVAGRDNYYPEDDPITSLIIFSEYFLPGCFNLFAVVMFLQSDKLLYRWVALPIAVTAVINVSIPLEKIFFNSYQVWGYKNIIPGLCVLELALLLGGSDGGRDRINRFVESRRMHRHTAHIAKSSMARRK